jgi:hypothetical protein
LDRLLETDGSETAVDAETESRIAAFCGDCHALPRPDSFHRDAWHDEVEKGYQFYAKSGRTDLDPPPPNQTVAYFRARAPEAIVYPEPVEADTPFGVAFLAESLSLPATVTMPPGLAGLRWARLGTDRPYVLLAADMMSGDVTAVDLRDPNRRVRRLARLRNPCHIEPCDLDADGNVDLLVADLGSYPAMDHDRGRVVWLRQSKPDVFDEVVLASGIGRVADARAADLDGDGDLDVLVAEFGWYRTGKMFLLRNVAPRGARPRFETELLDPRTGCIHLPVCDLNGDGRLDIVALVSNESECVEAFFNQGNAKFRRETLWRAPDLTFGSSGIELIDFDRDGDLDVLYANGDAFDNRYVSPWHGVQWLENLGQARFACHRLTDMSGACLALPGDFDADGDLDVLVTAFLPKGIRPETVAARRLPSIVLLEQRSAGQFARHTLEAGSTSHPAAVVADFDGDGDLDFAVGTHGAGAERVWLQVWWNQGPPR